MILFSNNSRLKSSPTSSFSMRSFLFRFITDNILLLSISLRQFTAKKKIIAPILQHIKSTRGKVIA
uniref:Uncharacterized protein n=1 Tax=Ascaris lumbricoides TaxID=6252 RepID=A0A0M3HYE7_ASCLU